jgi:FAD-dependent oxidoreductase domain-containing protein 1
MTKNSDIVIIGGGVMGSASGLLPAQRARPSTGTVTVIERDPDLHLSRASSRSASSIRQQFSTPLNIQLSLFGIDFLRRIEEHLAIDGETLSIGLREPGYLILSGRGDPRHPASQRRDAARARRQYDVLCAGRDRRSAFPGSAPTASPARASASPAKAPSTGPRSMQALPPQGDRRSARATRHGEVVAHRARRPTRRRGKASPTARASPAARWSTRPVRRPATWRRSPASRCRCVRASARCIFFKSPAKLPGLPLLIDINGVWVRHEGDGFVCGVVTVRADDDADAAPGDFEMDHRVLRRPVLADDRRARAAVRER